MNDKELNLDALENADEDTIKIIRIMTYPIITNFFSLDREAL